jgi:hypothetical protein
MNTEMWNATMLACSTTSSCKVPQKGFESHLKSQPEYLHTTQRLGRKSCCLSVSAMHHEHRKRLAGVLGMSLCGAACFRQLRMRRQRAAKQTTQKDASSQPDRNIDVCPHPCNEQEAPASPNASESAASSIDSRFELLHSHHSRTCP